MGKVKCNKGGLTNFIAYLEKLKGLVDSFFSSEASKVKSLNDEAVSYYSGLLSSLDQYDEDGNEKDDYKIARSRKGEADTNTGIISTALGKQSQFDNIFDKVISGLKKIETAVNKFEGEAGVVTFTVDTKKKTVVNEATGIEVTQLVFEVTGPDGIKREFTMSELLNAFYTTQGMQMNSVYQAALLREQLGLDPLTEKDIMHVLQTSSSIMNFAFDIGLYGISSEEDLKNYKQNLKDAGFEVSSDVKTLINSVDFGDDETKKKALEYLLSATNGAVFAGATSAAVAGLYGLYNNQSEVNLKDSEGENTAPSSPSSGPSDYPSSSGGNYSSPGSSSSPSSSSNNGQGRTGSSSNDRRTRVKKAIEQLASTMWDIPIEPSDSEAIKALEGVTESIPGMISPTIAVTELLVTPEDLANLPTELLPSIPEGIIKDYDDLARQQYESQGEEAIAQYRANVIADANAMFEASDKTPLITRLKNYGFSDKDIEIIIQDRNLTVSAIVSGDQRVKLTEIAEKLAKEDGITDFDTVYDNEQSAASLASNSVELLSLVTSDENVKKAYETLSSAETSYIQANNDVSIAMEKVSAAQNKINEVTETINNDIKTDPSKWDESSLKAYNDEVKELYENNITLNGSYNEWTDKQKTEYENKVEEIKDKYAEKTALEYSKASWGKEQIDMYNAAMNEYNEAVKAAQEAVTKLNEAKTGYTDAKTNLDTVKQEYYKKALEEQNRVEMANSQVGIKDPVDTQVNSGEQNIEDGIVISPEGASIVDTTSNQVNNESNEGNTGEVIINEDEEENYGVPIEDI